MKHRLLSCVESRIENKRSFYGRFQLGPFEEGEGVTVANSLRRSLLSEIPGVAITAVKIKGVTNEFSTLVGVREKVLDILLSLKEIVLTTDFQTQSPQVGYLHVQGPGIVRAKDLRLPTWIACVDPEQHIATLVNDGVLSMKLLICKGKSYSFQRPSGLVFPNKHLMGTEGFSNQALSLIKGEVETELFPHQKKKDITNLVKKQNHTFPLQPATPSDQMEEKIVASTYAKASTSPNLTLQERLLAVEQAASKPHLVQKGNLVSAKEDKPRAFTLFNSKRGSSQHPPIKPFVRQEPRAQIGYKPLSINQTLKGFSRVLPIDAVFMPVNKVNFLIEKDHNFETTKDFVILEVWTNGSVDPRQAIYRATKALIQLMSPFLEPKSAKKTVLQRAFSTKRWRNKGSSFLIPRSSVGVNARESVFGEKSGLSFPKERVSAPKTLSEVALQDNVGDACPQGKNQQQYNKHSTFRGSSENPSGNQHQPGKRNKHLSSFPTTDLFLDPKTKQVTPFSSLFQRSKGFKGKTSCFRRAASASFLGDLDLPSVVQRRTPSKGQRKDKKEDVVSELAEFLRNKTWVLPGGYDLPTKTANKNLLSLDIGNLDLQLSCYTFLKRNNVQTVADLLNRPATDLVDLQGFKNSFVLELNNNLQQIGLRLEL